ncbi:MAG: TetR family transcriptional regulator [Micavibrio aeruginosavorus]|uniref:TetR family transcriptional regulator n=1 Tax=Micavibrio aeruginosavorus TaxID=349221 RepID=A0A2W5MTJ5_9BACT|nr:MAG: TetR family transcriptional regulator [Micavibrio aeruginosavorus]
MSSTLKKTKRDEILETASKLFIENGFQSVSMDQLAAAVPVSKPTLYTHFQDKRDIFAAVLAERCELALESLRADLVSHGSPKGQIRAFGQHFLDLLLSKQALQLHKVIVAESDAFPEMARMFYETGPRRMNQLLAGYLQKANEDKLLDVPDVEMAASLFMGMIKSGLHMRCLLGVHAGEPTKAEKERVLDAAVSVFMKAYSFN